MENYIGSASDFEIRVKSLNQRGVVIPKAYENEVFTAFVNGIEPVQIKKMINETISSDEIKNLLNLQLERLIDWRDKSDRAGC